MMRVYILFSLLVLFSCKTTKPPVSVILLPNNWLFATGDDTLRKSINFKDNDWKIISTERQWNSSGFENYTGIAWYRQHLTIPIDLQKHFLVKESHHLLLQLYRINEADETYFNGVLIGKTGSVEPFIPQALKQRYYLIPDSIINWGQHNVIAIRVRSSVKNGGIFSSVLRITAPELQSIAKIKFKVLSDSTGVSSGNNPMHMQLTYLADSFMKSKGIKIHYAITDDNELPDTAFLINVENSVIKVTDSLVRDYSFITKVPGFYRFRFLLLASNGDTLSKFMFRMGYEPEKMQTITNRAADFEAFWNDTKRALAKIKPDYKVTRNDSLSNDSINVYLVEMRSLDSIIVRGWLCVPTKKGKYPAILEVPYYKGAFGPKAYLSDMIVFSLNIRGHGISRDVINPGFPGFLQYGVDSKENYIYRGVYMDCIRSLDFICSRKEVDTSRIAVYGVSQGGGLTLATASLDKRVKVAVSGVPFLSNYPTYFKVANWPFYEWKHFLKNNPDYTLDRVLNTLSYFDVMNHTQNMKGKLYMIVGLQDVTCPPVINYAAYNNVVSDKNVIVLPTLGHGACNEKTVMTIIRKEFNLQKY